MNPDLPRGAKQHAPGELLGPEIEALKLSISLSGLSVNHHHLQNSSPPGGTRLLPRNQPDLPRERTSTSGRATPAATPAQSHLASGFIRRRGLRERKPRPGLSNAWSAISPVSSCHAAKSLTIRVKHSGHESDCWRLIRVLL